LLELLHGAAKQLMAGVPAGRRDSAAAAAAAAILSQLLFLLTRPLLLLPLLLLLLLLQVHRCRRLSLRRGGILLAGCMSACASASSHTWTATRCRLQVRHTQA
jgi:hypothetical protein